MAIVAPHGGGIEPGTSEIAEAIAGRYFSFYSFDGLRSSDNELLHITSTRFDEPKCLNLIEHTDVVVTVHGCAGSDQVVFVGGLDIDFGEQIVRMLGQAGVRAIRAEARYTGDQQENICNRGRSGRGVQLEITESLRRTMFRGLDRKGRLSKTEVFRTFVRTVQNSLLAYDSHMH